MIMKSEKSATVDRLPFASEPVTQRLGEALAAVSYSELPARVIADTERAVLDWLGSALAGATEPPARMAQRVVAGMGSSNEATIFSAGRSSAALAAMANGIASHILEFDDVHKESTLHGGAPIISAALAVAERQHADGRSFILAVALGYEAALRIGKAVNPSHYYFWHPTGTVATFGAAAAASSLMKLNSEQMVNALGSAGTQAAGLWEFNSDGAMSKHLHPGKAAFNGILAADLARAGFTAASRILEGERGFVRAMSTSQEVSQITRGFGTQWKISENCYKLYSCCGHTHTAIDSALDLRAERNWSSRDVLEQVDHLRIETYGPGFQIIKEPNPRSPYEAKFSIAYCSVVALLEGVVGLEQFRNERFDQDGVRSADIAALLHRTEVAVSDELTAKYPSAWPVCLAIILKDGVILRKTSDYPRGNPEKPVSDAELEKKFSSLVEPKLGSEAVARALDVVRNLESRLDMADAFCDISPA
jgi:2-methylcitrate dehydratase PrpD